VADPAVHVRYFASAAEAAGRDEEVFAATSIGAAPALPGDAGSAPTVGDLRALLIATYGDAMARVLRSGSFLVDGVVSRDDARHIGARVDVLPPFAGG
jgi:molybdopterin synthase sulfur carrier subunit